MPSNQRRHLLRYFAIALLAIAATAAILWHRPQPPAIAAGTPVLLITIDTLRPDALGWIAGKNATPRIDQLTASGIAFDSAVSVTPLTLPSHTSIMSARFPARHGVRDNGQVVPSSIHVLAEILRDKGYKTGAFVSAYVLRQMFGLDKGFEHYDDHLTEGSEGWLDRPAGETVDAALKWIEPQAKTPWFAWIHLYDPHTPYSPPAEFMGNSPRENYDGEVRYVDRELGRLLDRLETLGEKPLIVLTADHGEAFGEHDEYEHGLLIYDTTTLVPLIFQHRNLPPSRPDIQPRLVDIAPTILDLLAFPALDGGDGISLAPSLFGKPQTVPAAYSETFQPWTTYGWSPLSAIHDRGWKLIDGPKPELYDLLKDPDELVNLAEDDPARLDRMTLTLETHRKPADLVDSTRIKDEATMRKLASLGYLGSASTSVIPTTGLPNPRERGKEREILRNAEVLLRANRLEEALAAFSEVLETDPKNRFAMLRSGISLLKLNRFDEAITRLRRSLELDPSQAETHYALADAYSRGGHLEEASAQWMETVRLQPRRSAAWGNLALVLSKLGRDKEALEAIKTALEIDPDDLRLLQNLALQQRKSGDREATVATLQKAAAVGGDEFAYAALLGLELYDLGRPKDAEPWLQRVPPDHRNFPEARFRLAQISVAAGRNDEARDFLAQAIRGNPALRAAAAGDPQLRGLLGPTG